jgi:hypothetical protein
MEFRWDCTWYAVGLSGVAGGVAFVDRRDALGDIPLELDWLPVFEARAPWVSDRISAGVNLATLGLFRMDSLCRCLSDFCNLAMSKSSGGIKTVSAVVGRRWVDVENIQGRKIQG